MSKLKSISRDAKAYGILTILLVLFLVVRSVSIPIYVDEVTTLKYYVKPLVVTPFGDYMRANNHIVNTVFTKISTFIFGENLFGLRLPNLLAFILYSIYTFKIGGFIKSKIVRWGFYISLLFPLNLIVFFGVSRGYGISFAFLLMSIYYLLQLNKYQPIKYLGLTLLGLNVSLYSNFTLLLGFFILSAFVLMSMLQNRNYYFSKINRWKTLSLTALHLLFTGFAVYVLMVYKSNGLLWWGSNLKTWSHSLDTVVQNLFGLDANLHFIEIFILVLSIIMIGVLFFAQKSSKISPSIIFTSLFVLSIIAVLVLHTFFGVNYPYQRTGMHFYLFLVLGYFFAIGTLKNKIVANVLSLPSLLIVFHFGFNFNLNKVNFWQDLNLPNATFEKVSSYEKGPDIASVRVFGVAKFNWMHTKYSTQNVFLPMTDFTDDDKNVYFDYVVDSKKRMKGIEGYFDSLTSQESSTLNLYKRKNPLDKELISEDEISERLNTSAEYYEFLRLNIDSNQNSTYNVELKAELETFDYPFQSFLVFAVENPQTKEKYSFKNIELDAKYLWNKDFPFLINGFIFDVPKGENVTILVYLWNKKKVDYTIHSSEMKLFSVDKIAVEQ